MQRNKDLRKQNEVAYGQVLKVRELEKKIEYLEAENQRLKRQTVKRIDPQPESIEAQLQELGVELNSPLEKAISETPEGIVETAIVSLEEASQSGRVMNPGGFPYKAITDAWKPNGSHLEKVNLRNLISGGKTPTLKAW